MVKPALHIQWRDRSGVAPDSLRRERLHARQPRSSSIRLSEGNPLRAAAVAVKATRGGGLRSRRRLSLRLDEPRRGVVAAAHWAYPRGTREWAEQEWANSRSAT
jgi:hypothetical protein